MQYLIFKFHGEKIEITKSNLELHVTLDLTPEIS